MHSIIPVDIKTLLQNRSQTEYFYVKTYYYFRFLSDNVVCTNFTEKFKNVLSIGRTNMALFRSLKLMIISQRHDPLAWW